MKKNKTIITVMVVGFVIVMGIMMKIIFFHEQNEEEHEDNVSINEELRDLENIDASVNEENDRTKEECIAILLDNKEDFEYVANVMKQWSYGYIYFDGSYSNYYEEIVVDNYFTTNDQEMADEISNNEEFYNHLLNLYNLGEIRGVFRLKSSEQYCVKFTFYKFPSGYHGGLYYQAYIQNQWPMYKIDRHWGLETVPND